MDGEEEQGQDPPQDNNEGDMDMEGDVGTDDGNSAVYYPLVQYPRLETNGLGVQEWHYHARRSCQEIIPGLYLGPYSAVTKNSRENLANMGITHIVCVRSPVESAVIRTNHPESFQYLVVEINDSPFQGIIPEIKRVITFLDGCFSNGGKALVHGTVGLTRSAAMVVGYVMWRYGVTAKEAKNYVQSKRFCVNVTEHFMNQLVDFEACVRAMHDVPASCSGAQNPHKRQNEGDGDDDDEGRDNGGKRHAGEVESSEVNMANPVAI